MCGGGGDAGGEGRVVCVRGDYQESTLASRPRRGCHDDDDDYDYDDYVNNVHHVHHDDVNNDHHHDNCPANHHLHVFDDLGPHE